MYASLRSAHKRRASGRGALQCRPYSQVMVGVQRAIPTCVVALGASSRPRRLGLCHDLRSRAHVRTAIWRIFGSSDCSDSGDPSNIVVTRRCRTGDTYLGPAKPAPSGGSAAARGSRRRRNRPLRSEAMTLLAALQREARLRRFRSGIVGRLQRRPDRGRGPRYPSRLRRGACSGCSHCGRPWPRRKGRRWKSPAGFDPAGGG